MIARLWRRAKRAIPRGALALSVITAVSVVLGFAREGVIAYYFGTSADLDAFLVAYTLPRIIPFQAVTLTVSVVLPPYVAGIEGGRPEAATALLRRWTWFLARAATVFCVVVALLADVIVVLIAPGLSEAQQETAATWLRWLSPLIWMITMSGCFKVVLDHNRRFFMPQMSSALISACTIAGCVIGASGFGVAALIPGMLVGAIVGFGLQWRQARIYEPRILSPRNLPDHVRLPLVSGGIVILNSFAQQANILIDRAFASSLPKGSIAALNYANSVISVPQAIISGALATALFPVLSELIARGQWKQAYGTTVRWSTVVLVFGMLPVAAFAFFGEPLVALLFQRGAFDAAATTMTSSAMFVLSFVLLATGCNSMVVRLLLAQQQLRLLLVTTLLSIAVKIVANIVLVDRFGLIGVATATVLGTTSAMVVRFWGAWLYRNEQAPPAGDHP